MRLAAMLCYIADTVERLATALAGVRWGWACHPRELIAVLPTAGMLKKRLQRHMFTKAKLTREGHICSLLSLDDSDRICIPQTIARVLCIGNDKPICVENLRCCGKAHRSAIRGTPGHVHVHVFHNLGEFLRTSENIISILLKIHVDMAPGLPSCRYYC